MIDCDFIPAHYHEQQALRRAVKIRAFCVGTMFVIMAIWIFVHHHRLSNAESMLSEIRLQKDQIRIHAAKRAAMKMEKARLHDRQQLIDQLSNHASLVLVYSDLSRRLPETVVLTKVSLKCPSLSAYVDKEEPESDALIPRANPRRAIVPEEDEIPEIIGNELTMTGIAVSQGDVIQFAAALEKSPLFDQVYMEAKDPTLWAGRRAQRFELVCELVPHDRN
ncbi:MAG: PilN domain-containing protein [Phycisphaerales bacterium]|nr:PilN domain-containing protein [Phycisphaerales bacterium]